MAFAGHVQSIWFSIPMIAVIPTTVIFSIVVIQTTTLIISATPFKYPPHPKSPHHPRKFT